MDKENTKIQITENLAHVDYKSRRCQSMKKHLENVAFMAGNSCSLEELKPLIVLIGILHDIGKFGRENQEDFKNILVQGNESHKHGLDHSTAGGRLAQELIKEGSVAEFISTVIYFHHGMGDCINLDNGQGIQQHRNEKEIDYEWIKEEFFQTFRKEVVEEYCKKAIESYKYLYGKVTSFYNESKALKRKCGNGYFFMGMYFRVALSLLIDGDWTDTACFFQNVPLTKRISLDETQKIWQECIDNFEEYMEQMIRNNPANGNLLNKFRQEISDSCRQAAETNRDLWRDFLNFPYFTGFPAP